jgi:transmembrane sensor
MAMSTDRNKKIEVIAGDWLARRDSGQWSKEDQRRFDEWLNESPLHRVTYLRLEHVWERSERLQALGAGVPPGVIPPANRWNLSPFFEHRERAPARRAHWVRARAAAIVVGAGLGSAY